MGLADLRPLQEEALAEIRRSVMAQEENISADGLLKTWIMGASSAFDILRDMTQGVLSQMPGPSGAAAEPKEYRQGWRQDLTC